MTTDEDALRREIKGLYPKRAKGDLTEKAFQRDLAARTVDLYRKLIEGRLAGGETIEIEHHVVQAHMKVTQSVLRESEQEAVSLFATGTRLFRLKSTLMPNRPPTADAEDNTTVDVTPGPLSGIKSGVSGLAANGAGQVVLNAGDVIQIVTKSGTNDLTGSLITADKSVQVISGHQCTFIPSTVGYCDHLEESTFPYETLASRYVVTATLINPTTTKAQMVRIVATKDNTALTYNPPQPGAPGTIATAGQYVELDSIDADFQITADNPILVTQYMTGQDAGGNAGDPAMTLAVATDQFRKTYLFHAPTNYSSNYVNVVAPTGIPVILDGALLGGFTPIGTTGYSVSRASLSNAGNGNHSISASQGIGITVYGYGQYTSYWYPGGLNLTKLHD